MEAILELWAKTYPRDFVVHGLLSGFASQGLARYEQAIDEAQKSVALDPDFSPGYTNLAFGSFYRDRLDDAATAIQRAWSRKLESADLLTLHYQLAFLRQDRTAMQRDLALAANVPGAEDWLSNSEALVLARSGQLEAARSMTRRAVDAAMQSGQKEKAATYEAGQAVWEGLFGDSAAARQHAEAAIGISKGRDVEFAAAIAYALSGDLSRCDALAKDLRERFPEDTAVVFNYLPSVSGLVALRRGQPSKAIELLQPAVPYELAVTPLAYNTFFGEFYPVYVRGEAYLAENRNADAAREFQKMLDHRGLLAADPLGAIAYVELGRACAAAGDKNRARTAYETFLTTWSKADPGSLLLKRAGNEHAKLQ